MDTNISATATEDAELDALLGGLDIAEADLVTIDPVTDEPVEETIVDEPVEETVADIEASAAELDDDAVRELEAEMDLHEAREEVYASQEAEDVNLDPETAAPAAPAKKASTAPKKERVARITAESLPADAFVLTSDIPTDLDANKAAVLASCPAQKKVKEKFDNLLVAIHQGRAPSTYVMDCFRALKAKGGEITSPDLVAALKATPLKNGASTYSEGTARSQVGQIMALFPALKIAARSGNKLTLNPDSLLAMALDQIDAPAAVEEIPAVEEPTGDAMIDDLVVENEEGEVA